MVLPLGSRTSTFKERTVNVEGSRMRENRTYGLTRGRSGSAASLYSTANKICENLVRHEACGKYTTYVDARTTRAKMPISLKEVRLIWRKREIKSSH